VSTSPRVAARFRRCNLRSSLWMVGIFLTPVAQGDNQKMIEQRTQELIGINEQAVRQVPNLPKDGQVELKAQVQPRSDGTYDIQILESKVMPPTPHADGTASVWDSRLFVH